jgi:hypothetical protein
MLFIALAVGPESTSLGNFEAVEIIRGELRDAASKTLLARHFHHRWMRQSDEPHTFERLEVIGPAFIIAIDGAETRLGPYGHFACVNGVFYADQRVFGFMDVQNMDLYLSDIGRHCSGMRLVYNKRG